MFKFVKQTSMKRSDSQGVLWQRLKIQHTLQRVKEHFIHDRTLQEYIYSQIGDADKLLLTPPNQFLIECKNSEIFYLLYIFWNQDFSIKCQLSNNCRVGSSI